MATKETLRKFCDSVLSKCAKLRGLMADLRKNYPDDNMAQRPHTYIVENTGCADVPCQAFAFMGQCLPTPSPCRSVTNLEKDLEILDAEYNALSDCMAQGEVDNFDTE